MRTEMFIRCLVCHQAFPSAWTRNGREAYAITSRTGICGESCGRIQQHRDNQSMGAEEAIARLRSTYERVQG